MVIRPGILLASLVLAGCDDRVFVSGRVVDEDGPVAGRRVTLGPAFEDEVDEWTVTDRHGVFAFWVAPYDDRLDPGVRIEIEPREGEAALTVFPRLYPDEPNAPDSPWLRTFDLMLWRPEVMVATEEGGTRVSWTPPPRGEEMTTVVWSPGGPQRTTDRELFIDERWLEDGGGSMSVHGFIDDANGTHARLADDLPVQGDRTPLSRGLPCSVRAGHERYEIYELDAEACRLTDGDLSSSFRTLAPVEGGPPDAPAPDIPAPMTDVRLDLGEAVEVGAVIVRGTFADPGADATSIEVSVRLSEDCVTETGEASATVDPYTRSCMVELDEPITARCVRVVFSAPLIFATEVSVF